MSHDPTKAAKDLISRYEFLVHRVSDLNGSLFNISDENQYRKHAKCHVAITQGSKDMVAVEVPDAVVRAHFELALEKAKKDLRETEQKLYRLQPVSETDG